MNRLANFFTHKITLLVLGLCALSVVIWYGADYIKFGEDNLTLSTTTRLVLISASWFIAILWHFIAWLIERKQNAALIESLQQTEEDAISPDEERSNEELTAIAERFKDALAVLKKARFKKGGRSRSLYQLPWYIIIGPPGAGKTTALINSGLEFPLAKQDNYQPLGGIGGTRNCDWWFTNDAVLIDTAGRYTTQDSHRTIDSSSWQAFIELLKKYRRRRPINGALIAISLQDLMVQTADQRAHQAKTIRTRISELHREFGLQFPIYLTFTKCDLVAGFSEFFSNLSQAEREQVWGVSFPHNPQEGGLNANIQSFESEFEQLIARLNQRLLWRTHQERNIEKRSALHGFPARMESLSNVLTDFIKQTFNPNRYDADPLLRGVYFTSATQEGSPIDRMMASVSANFGLERDMGKQQTNSGKSFFLHRLLKDIVFPESELVGTNKKLEASLVWGRRIALATAATATAATLVLWFGSLAQNARYMNQVNEHIASYKALMPETSSPSSTSNQTVAQAFEALSKAQSVYDQQEHPWLYNLGLYDASVDEAADALYRHELARIFLPYTAHQLEQQLKQQQGDADALLKTLRAYAMLFSTENRRPEEISKHMAELWQQSLTGKADIQQQLDKHLAAALMVGDFTAINKNERLVARSQRELNRVPIAQRLYKKMANSPLGSQQANLVDAIGIANPQDLGMNPQDTRLLVPMLFTKAGYEELDFSETSPMLQEVEQDQWLYGSSNSFQLSDKDKKDIAENVKRLYMANYVDTWRDALRSINIAKHQDTARAIAQLDELSDPITSPLLRMIELTAENTSLAPVPELPKGVDVPASMVPGKAGRGLRFANRGLDALGNRLPSTYVDEQFKDIHKLSLSMNNQPAAIQDYLAAIETIKELLIEIDSAANPNAVAFDMAKGVFAAGGGGKIKQLRIKALDAPAPLNQWLTDIADNAWALVLGKAKSHINRAWQEQVYAGYQNNLKNRYPLSANESFEAPMSEFNQFFKPGGTQQKFVQAYLSPFVDTRQWKLKYIDGLSIGLSNESLRQFRQADHIRNTYYAGSANANMSFKIEPTKLDSGVRLFSLEVGEERVNYSHGPRTLKPMVWEGGKAMRVRVIFEDLNETVHRKHYEGDWAWFRLLDASRIDTTNNRNIKTITFEENGRQAEFKLIADSGKNPFDNRVLRNYNCPQYL
ncbi:type VI secretion system membrane subunit TssM [Simiduia sp. 21SJ11W-1]|uniref:type VI secretion system membrane subunit TssM n=1 Tax=Simiduia sp. 21SJ11W-1 TaxID=2909669 RepID=UPI0020A0C98E|nr:type VI secretion system membrane subunit TssM [Simiduia sp. 21SJ11W-1]UTA46618.1 type VI secretion system membrane subunit TssM [Simiduia sp. 21SJ11W-1]